LFGAIINKDLQVTNQIIYYSVAFFFGVIFFMAAYNLVYQIIIVSTSFVGAYLIVRGISLYVGDFPNEIDLHNNIIHGKFGFSDINLKYGFV